MRFAFGVVVSSYGFMIFFRSDPTENDSVEGLRPNAMRSWVGYFWGVYLYHFVSLHIFVQTLFSIVLTSSNFVLDIVTDS